MLKFTFIICFLCFRHYVFRATSGLCNFDNRWLVVSCSRANLTSFPDFSATGAETFILDSNNFSTISSSTFPGCSVKEIIILNNPNPMLVAEDAFEKKASSLMTLHLQNVKFDFRSMFSPVSNLTNLQELVLGNSRWKSPRHLKDMILHPKILRNLRTLIIFNSGVADVSETALPGPFDHLELLGFPGNELTTIPKGIKHVLASIRYRHHITFTLSLRNNRIDTLEKSHLPNECPLTKLDLAYNRLRCLGPNILDNCPYLIDLDLQGNELLQYLNPSLFKCLQPKILVHVQHTGIQTVEFAWRYCVAVFFSNSSVLCDCKLQDIAWCKPHLTGGDCSLNPQKRRLTLEEIMRAWTYNICSTVSQLGFPEVNEIQGCGQPYRLPSASHNCDEEYSKLGQTIMTSRCEAYQAASSLIIVAIILIYTLPYFTM